MIYFLNNNLNNNNQLKLELKKFYGLNHKLIFKIFNFLGLNNTIKTKELTKKKINSLKEYIIKNILIEEQFKQQLYNNNKKQLYIKLIKSLRKLKGLPVNGQRTKTNAKTTKKLFFIK